MPAHGWRQIRENSEALRVRPVVKDVPEKVGRGTFGRESVITSSRLRQEVIYL